MDKIRKKMDKTGRAMEMEPSGGRQPMRVIWYQSGKKRLHRQFRQIPVIVVLLGLVSPLSSSENYFSARYFKPFLQAMGLSRW